MPDPITTNTVVTNTITATLSKPAIGLAGGGLSGFALFLHWCGIVTTVAGTIGTVLGAVIAGLHLYYFLKAKWQKKYINPFDI